ncbi:MAG TPA: sigma 54-interacting transcriptional regulator [Polyangiaceae bacterium]
MLRGVIEGDHTALVLAGERWVLGRGGECDIRLSKARVSRRHVEIRRRGPIYVVSDLESTNGTYVDGESIEQAVIKEGSVLRLGEWLGVVEEQSSEDEPCRFGEQAPGIWGGAGIAAALRPLVRAASSSLPVFLVGRTGTGKERFARAIHELGRNGQPFHAINCAALVPSLAEAELFGYRKGAFTGAERNYAGHLRAAQGGTLLLDEIADLPPPVQAKLLRALDTGDIAPLGESAEARFDARIVSACQEPIAALVASGRLREDLAARLSGLVVTLPELKHRRADIPALFDRFLRRYSGATAPPVSTRLYERLCLYDWPGNVRELELLARQLLSVHGLEPLLRRSHLPEGMRERSSAPESEADGTMTDRNERDIETLTLALKNARGNVKAAAKFAGISRQRAYRLIGSRRLAGVVVASREDMVDVDGENERSD